MKLFISKVFTILSFGITTIFRWLAKKSGKRSITVDLDRDGSPDLEIHVIPKQEENTGKLSERSKPNE